MSDKIRIGLWKNESAKGNTYLSGKGKDGTRFYVFVDSKNAEVRNLRTKAAGADDLTNAATLNKRVSERDGEESIFYSSGEYLVGENLYYYNRDKETGEILMYTNSEGVEVEDTRLTKKDGTIVMNSETGEPRHNPTHNLVIG